MLRKPGQAPAVMDHLALYLIHKVVIKGYSSFLSRSPVRPNL